MLNLKQKGNIIFILLLTSASTSFGEDLMKKEIRLENKLKNVPHRSLPKNMQKANESAQKKLKHFSPQAGGAGPVIGTPFNTNCAQGFSKLGDDKKNYDSKQWVDWYVCGTPIIKCPAQIQGNGLYSTVTPIAIVNQVGGNPDGGQVSFRIQYKCDYSYSNLPEG